MTTQDFNYTSAPRTSPRKFHRNRKFTTVVYPPDVFRNIKALSRRNGISVSEQTLLLCAVALKIEDPSFSPPLPERTQLIMDGLNDDAVHLDGDRKARLIDAIRMIRKLTIRIARLTA